MSYCVHNTKALTPDIVTQTDTNIDTYTKIDT